MSNAFLGASRLLGATDGVDKLTKFVIGVFTTLSTTNTPLCAHYGDSARQLSDIRSVLRLSRLLALTLKIHSLIDLVAAQGFVWTERKKFVEIFKIVFDLLYAAGDHAHLLARKGLLGNSVDTARLQRRTMVARLCCHLLGTLFGLFELRDAARKLNYDPPAAKRACKISAVGVTRDAVDTVVTVSIASRAGSAYKLGPRVDGALVCLSGGLSLYLSWQSTV
ncbi:glycosomal membrane protein-like protein [Novymonas esmeraldas]|uniref:Glycosomal membrane protein-like protein n=1 Tax=Novymonas esmeraldas TaxID=1808958 RepID=A0AAW0EY49_9TRYP